MTRWAWWAVAVALAGGILTGCGTAPRNPATAPAGTPVTAAMAGRTRMQAVDFLNPGNGWLAGQGVIWKTTDSGRSWRATYFGPAGLRAIKFVNARDGWAWSWRRLLSTTDGGSTWQQVYQAAAGPLASLSWTGPETGYAVIGAASGPPGRTQPGGGLYRTNDGGSSWQPVATPFHPSTVSFWDSRQGWAVGDSRIWHTADGGKSWMPAFIYGHGVPVPMAAEIRLSGPDEVWVLLRGDSGMSQTSYTVFHHSPGKEWQVVAAVSTAGAGPAPDAPAGAPGGPESSPGPLVAVGPNTAVLGGVCEACGLGEVALWRTSDGGADWTRYPPIYGAGGIPGPYAISFANAQQGWLVDGNGYTQVLATTDGGATWRQVFPAVSASVQGVSFVGADHGFGLGSPGDPNAVLATTDGGVSWAAIGRIPASGNRNPDYGQPGLVFTSPSDGWALRANRLWDTVDGGRTWKPVALPGFLSSDSLTNLAMAGRYGAVGSFSNDVCWWSVDGGRTWNRAQRESFGQALEDFNISVHAEAEAAGFGTALQGEGAGNGVEWIVFNYQRWAVSTDNGRDWTVHDAPGQVTSSGGIGTLTFADPSHGWIETGSGSLFRTTDGGRDWTLLGG